MTLIKDENIINYLIDKIREKTVIKTILDGLYILDYESHDYYVIYFEFFDRRSKEIFDSKFNIKKSEYNSVIRKYKLNNICLNQEKN